MNLIAILPEIILFSGALIILIFDIFLGKYFKNAARLSFLGSVIITIACLYTAILQRDNFETAFNYSVTLSPFISYAKIVTLILLFAVILISAQFAELEKRISAEFAALIMISTTGSLLLISANDLLVFYMALELQSLPLYILAAIKRDSSKSSEAGMKYFLLGAVASGLLLFGISLIYGFYGTTNIGDIVSGAQNSGFAIGMLFGFILIITALFFKISAAPFHMWTPDVYEGSTMAVTSFFASVIKFISVLVLIRIYISAIGFWPSINQVLIAVSILSLLVGCFGALKQTNLKRMLAYSAIGHIGFVLAGVSAGTFEAVKAAVLYMTIYGAMSVGSFAFLTLLKNNNVLSNDPDKLNDDTYELSSLTKIASKNPVVAIFVSIIMFSMAGIPPMAGFFAKFYVLIAVVQKELYGLAVVAVLTSVVSAFYYLRIVKIMYFDSKEKAGITIDNNKKAYFVLAAAALFNLLLFVIMKQFLFMISNILL